MKTNPSIASDSEVSDGQIETCVTLVTDATRKGTGTALRELIKNGVLNKQNIERVRASGHEVVAAITQLVKEKFAEIAENIVDRVKLISGGVTLEIDPTDGKAIIHKAGDVFTGYIDSNFKNWDLNVASGPTKKTPVQVYEMIKDGTFAQIFGGMSDDLDKLCLTQNQIIRFVQDHRKWLRQDGYGTFFLFKKMNEFFVANVYLDSDGPYVFVNRLSDGHVWGAEFRHRIVVPQLALET